MDTLVQVACTKCARDSLSNPLFTRGPLFTQADLLGPPQASTTPSFCSTARRNGADVHGRPVLQMRDVPGGAGEP